MTFFSNLGSMVAALAGVKVDSILRERIALIHNQLAIAEKKEMQLAHENEQLRRALEDAEKKLAAYAVTEQFTERGGALFKRDGAGRYVRVVYCPICNHSTSAFPPGGQFVCDPCHWFSPFLENELDEILSEEGFRE